MPVYKQILLQDGGEDRKWNESIQNLPAAHVLQTWEWGSIKKQNGWDMLPLLWMDENGIPRAAAMVLKKTIRLGGFAYQPTILYIPRGPMLDWNNTALYTQVLNDIQSLAKHHHAIFIKMDPEIILGKGVPGTDGAIESTMGMEIERELQCRGWRDSREQIQFRNTIWLDLSPGVDQVMRGMKQKFRYNIRLAERKGVRVRIGEEKDLTRLYQIYAQTAVRDGFIIRSEKYYLHVWQTFMRSGMAAPLLAEEGDEIIAGLILFWFGERAWYLYGMSSEVFRDIMPNHILQWEAIRLAAGKGCTSYDLWGAPDIFIEKDSMWGVYKFKEGMGGTIIRTMGAWDFPTWVPGYELYTNVLPRVLNVMRRHGRDRIRQEVMG